MRRVTKPSGLSHGSTAPGGQAGSGLHSQEPQAPPELHHAKLSWPSGQAHGAMSPGRHSDCGAPASGPGRGGGMSTHRPEPGSQRWPSGQTAPSRSQGDRRAGPASRTQSRATGSQLQPPGQGGEHGPPSSEPPHANAIVASGRANHRIEPRCPTPPPNAARSELTVAGPVVRVTWTTSSMAWTAARKVALPSPRVGWGDGAADRGTGNGAARVLFTRVNKGEPRERVAGGGLRFPVAESVEEGSGQPCAPNASMSSGPGSPTPSLTRRLPCSPTRARFHPSGGLPAPWGCSVPNARALASDPGSRREARGGPCHLRGPARLLAPRGHTGAGREES